MAETMKRIGRNLDAAREGAWGRARSPYASPMPSKDIDSNPQEVRIRQLIADAQEHQFDVTELMKLHHDDAVIVNMAGRRLFGKADFEQAMKQALSSDLRHVPAVMTVDRVLFLGPDCAVVSCTKTVQDRRPAADRAALPGSVGMTTYVVVREGDAWVIASAQTTPQADQAAAFSATQRS